MRYINKQLNIIELYLSKYLNRSKIHERAKPWQNFSNAHEKKILRKYLSLEQNGLCIYCEKKLRNEKALIDDFHIEHLIPKHLAIDKKTHLAITFNYRNLTASCIKIKDNSNNRNLTCGHKKNEVYDKNLFLDPTKLENIQDYFEYDSVSGNILPSTKRNAREQHQAKYMIDTLLDLNCLSFSDNSHDNFLPINRMCAYKAVKTIIDNKVKQCYEINKTATLTQSQKSEIRVLFNKIISAPCSYVSFIKSQYKVLLSI